MLCPMRCQGVEEHSKASNQPDCPKVANSFHFAHDKKQCIRLRQSRVFISFRTEDTACGQLGSPLIFALPRVLVKEVRETTETVLDSLLWAQDPSFATSLIGQIDDLQEEMAKGAGGSSNRGRAKVCFWPPRILDEKDDGAEKIESGTGLGEYTAPGMKEFP